jgi:hypothetical protein
MFIFKNREFPRWSGPLIGILAGGYCGLSQFRPGGLPIWITVLGGAIIGGLAGCLIFLLDPGRPVEASEGLPEHLVNTSCRPSGLVGRVLALLGLLLCWTPFLGLVLNLIGILVNRKTDDWSLVVSKVGLVFSAFVTTVTLIGFILDW